MERLIRQGKLSTAGTGRCRVCMPCMGDFFAGSNYQLWYYSLFVSLRSEMNKADGEVFVVWCLIISNMVLILAPPASLALNERIYFLITIYTNPTSWPFPGSQNFVRIFPLVHAQHSLRLTIERCIARKSMISSQSIL